MIIYHPRNDLYHCMYRFITIAKLQNLEEFDFVRLRIYDIFFVFPYLVESIAFPRVKGVLDVKKKAAKIHEPYEILPDKKRLFSEMGDYHIQALQILIAKDIFSEINGKLRLSRGFDAKGITNLLSNNQKYSDGYMSSLIDILNQVDLMGESGLKKRTGLMEYRYDPV